jgi:hypothetical protein
MTRKAKHRAEREPMFLNWQDFRRQMRMAWIEFRYIKRNKR